MESPFLQVALLGDRLLGDLFRLRDILPMERTGLLWVQTSTILELSRSVLSPPDGLARLFS
eukprot:5711686-Pyramimonas_sp.AAC.1